MRNRIKKLLAGSCMWMLLGCSQSCSPDSVRGRTDPPGEAVSTQILQNGKQQFFSGHYDAALNTWAGIDSPYPFSFPVDTWRARALLMKQEPDRAFELLHPYLQLIPGHPELLLLLGKSQFERGNYAEAVELLEQGAACVHGLAGVYLTRAEMFYQIGLHSRAGRYRRIAQRLLHLEDGKEVSDAPQ